MEKGKEIKTWIPNRCSQIKNQRLKENMENFLEHRDNITKKEKEAYVSGFNNGWKELRREIIMERRKRRNEK